MKSLRPLKLAPVVVSRNDWQKTGDGSFRSGNVVISCDGERWFIYRVGKGGKLWRVWCKSRPWVFPCRAGEDWGQQNSQTDGAEVKIELDLDSIEDYRMFLKIKSLPVFRFTGREAWFPDEYCSLIGCVPEPTKRTVYKSHPKAFDYQRDIAKTAINKRKYAVFMEPGRGKTLIDFEFTHAALNATGKRVLLVAPPMVVRQMITEHERFYPSMEAPTQLRANNLAQWITQRGPAFGITNFEAIREGLPQGNLGALIISESSMLKSQYGEWGQRLIELGKGLEWKLCETGTPAPNDRIEYANHAVFLDQFPTVNSFLAKFFVNTGETGERWELKQHAMKSFYRTLSHWCIFLSDPSVYGWKDNCEPLLPINTHIIDVELTEAQKKEVDRLSGGLFGIIPTAKGIKNGIASRSMWSRLAKGFDTNGNEIDSHKPGIVCKLAQEAPSIVWCRFNAEQEALAKMMPRAANVSGDTEEEQRIERVTGFQEGKYKILLTKPKILGFGLNLQVARRQVFSTIQDSYEEVYQAIKRSNRTGSKYPLDVFIPVTDLERPMLQTVLNKADRVSRDTKEQEAIFREASGGK